LSASGRDFRLRAPQFRKSRHNSHHKVGRTGEDDGCGTAGKVRAQLRVSPAVVKRAVTTVERAITCLGSEPVLSGAVIASEIPTVDRPEKNVLELIKTGDYVKVDGTAGIIEVVEK